MSNPTGRQILQGLPLAIVVAPSDRQSDRGDPCPA